MSLGTHCTDFLLNLVSLISSFHDLRQSKHKNNLMLATVDLSSVINYIQILVFDICRHTGNKLIRGVELIMVSYNMHIIFFILNVIVVYEAQPLEPPLLHPL